MQLQNGNEVMKRQWRLEEGEIALKKEAKPRGGGGGGGGGCSAQKFCNLICL